MTPFHPGKVLDSFNTFFGSHNDRPAIGAVKATKKAADHPGLLEVYPPLGGLGAYGRERLD
ncbi:MAG: hypothetical protein EBQ73_04985 [Gammaproteobacteria bacterium]|nr:hypothetical protein [Gammaproteobacteria bacterium]